jgi:ABC-2 type transport system ATP-binding protein
MSRRSHTRRPEAPPALEVEGLTKRYGDVAALDDVDLVVPAGQSVVLVGHNGSGKSTLLGMVAGSLEPTDGTIAIRGRAVDSIAARAMRSWLPDAPVLYDDLSLREHLDYVAAMHGVDDASDRIADLVGRLGLEGREDQLPSQFSRGLRQKTAIAVALVRPFSLLLVDEPFVGLDGAGRTALLELLEEAVGGGATVVVATHDPAVVERFERGVVLADGEVVHDGPASEVLDRLSADERHTGH